MQFKSHDIFKKYADREGIDIAKIFFLYNGNIISDNLYLNEIINKEDKKMKNYEYFNFS